MLRGEGELAGSLGRKGAQCGRSIESKVGSGTETDQRDSGYFNLDVWTPGCFECKHFKPKHTNTGYSFRTCFPVRTLFIQLNSLIRFFCFFFSMVQLNVHFLHSILFLLKLFSLASVLYKFCCQDLIHQS